MKIQLVPDPAPQAPAAPQAPLCSQESAAAPAATQGSRIAYENCPLCEGADLTQLKQVDANHDSVNGPQVDPTWDWNGCETCGHIFAAGYLNADVHGQVLARGGQEPTSAADLAQKRQEAATIVHRISSMRGCIGGVWLDVGFGAGDLLCTAQEFGYDTVGVDLRITAVENATQLGFEAACASIEDLTGEGLYDIISFSNVLGHTTFPIEALKAATRLLRSGGVVFIATPNLDCRAWHLREENADNPEWSEIERTHLFSREHLCWALRRAGLEPCDYMTSASSAVGMEICATLASDDA